MKAKSRFLRAPVEPFAVLPDAAAGDLLARMERISFQGRNLAVARRIWEKMLGDNCTIFLGMAGALSAGGLRTIVAYLIAGRIKANIREIEGSLTRMIAFCSLSGRDMSVELAQEVLADLWGEEERVITMEHIQRKVAEFFGIKLSDMRAKNRTKSVAFPRQVAMYLSRQLTHASLSDIGRAFGGKDHTTVIHAVSKLQALLQEDPKLKQTIDTLTQGITL